jgi:hypothetical protein
MTPFPLAFSYYVYYRVARPAEARDGVARLQRALQERLGIHGRLLAKRGEPSLWMEVYEGIADVAAFERLLVALVEETGLDRALEAGSERKSECFEDRPCA